MDILGRIKQLRDDRGWSNYRLAKEAGISEGSLNNLFRLNNQPTVPTLEAICAGLGVSLSQFFAIDGEPVALTPEQTRHLRLWGTLRKEQQEILDSFIKTL